MGVHGSYSGGRTSPARGCRVTRTSLVRDEQGSYRYREQTNPTQHVPPSLSRPTVFPLLKLGTPPWAGGGSSYRQDAGAGRNNGQLTVNHGRPGARCRHQRQKWAPQRTHGTGAQQQPYSCGATSAAAWVGTKAGGKTGGVGWRELVGEEVQRAYGISKSSQACRNSHISQAGSTNSGRAYSNSSNSQPFSNSNKTGGGGIGEVSADCVLFVV